MRQESLGGSGQERRKFANPPNITFPEPTITTGNDPSPVAEVIERTREQLSSVIGDWPKDGTLFANARALEQRLIVPLSL